MSAESLPATISPLAIPPVAQRPEVRVAIPFSLFEGDLLNRIYVQLGLGTHRRYYLLRRSIVMILMTWVPVAVLAWRQHLYEWMLSPINYFVDLPLISSLSSLCRCSWRPSASSTSAPARRRNSSLVAA